MCTACHTRLNPPPPTAEVFALPLICALSLARARGRFSSANPAGNCVRARRSLSISARARIQHQLQHRDPNARRVSEVNNRTAITSCMSDTARRDEEGEGVGNALAYSRSLVWTKWASPTVYVCVYVWKKTPVTRYGSYVQRERGCAIGDVYGASGSWKNVFQRDGGEECVCEDGAGVMESEIDSRFRSLYCFDIRRV